MQTNLRSDSHDLTLLSRDRGYRWDTDNKSNLLYQVRATINSAGLSTHDIWELVYDTQRIWISPRTIDNLMNGKTKSPQLRTVSLIMAALGYNLEWTQRSI